MLSFWKMKSDAEDLLKMKHAPLKFLWSSRPWGTRLFGRLQNIEALVVGDENSQLLSTLSLTTQAEMSDGLSFITQLISIVKLEERCCCFSQFWFYQFKF